LNIKLYSDINNIVKDLEIQNKDVHDMKKKLNSNFDNNVYLNEEKRRIESDVSLLNIIIFKR